MATSHIKYPGNLRTQALHYQSGNTIITDAPTDNQGKGEAFSPTDLVATALGSCMITIMGIVADTHKFNIDGLSADITKVMASDPRRICEVIIDFNFRGIALNSHQRKLLENAALHCPVAKSIHPDIKQTIIFNYE